MISFLATSHKQTKNKTIQIWPVMFAYKNNNNNNTSIHTQKLFKLITQVHHLWFWLSVEVVVFLCERWWRSPPVCGTGTSDPQKMPAVKTNRSRIPRHQTTEQIYTGKYTNRPPNFITAQDCTIRWIRVTIAFKGFKESCINLKN